MESHPQHALLPALRLNQVVAEVDQRLLAQAVLVVDVNPTGPLGDVSDVRSRHRPDCDRLGETLDEWTQADPTVPLGRLGGGRSFGRSRLLQADTTARRGHPGHEAKYVPSSHSP
jgi:hypothetical protein